MTKEGWARIDCAFSTELIQFLSRVGWMPQSPWHLTRDTFSLGQPSETIGGDLSTLVDWKLKLFSISNRRIRQVRWSISDCLAAQHNAKRGRKDGLKKKGRSSEYLLRTKRKETATVISSSCFFGKFFLRTFFFSRTNDARNGFRLVIRFKLSMPGFADSWLPHVCRIEMIYSGGKKKRREKLSRYASPDAEGERKV